MAIPGNSSMADSQQILSPGLWLPFGVLEPPARTGSLNKLFNKKTKAAGTVFSNPQTPVFSNLPFAFWLPKTKQGHD